MGATFAYFTATVSNDFASDATGSNAQGATNVTAGQVNGSGDAGIVIANVDGNAGSFTATDIYPGHKEVAMASITNKNPNGTSAAVRISYTPSANDFSNDQVRISVYKSSTAVNVGTSNYFNCSQQTANVDASTIKYFETCTVANTTLGTAVVEDVAINGTTELTLAASEQIAGSAAGTTVYYYFVVEFVNNGDQNTEQAKNLTGKINIDLI
ncbi:MAG: hypothetical protein IJ704_00890 [Bacilli bacterium]|nr:hypothetical protein [Bacilli bacterium]